MFTPYSWITYDGDGTTDTFGVPFPYVAREHVHVYLGWDPSTRSFDTELVHDIDFTYASGNEITLAVPPGALEELTLLRITPIDEQLTEWQTGSPPTARELDVADRQVLYAVQEFIDQTLQTREDLDDAVLVGAGVTLIDNLSSVLTNAALTANQGRVLRLLVEAAEGLVVAAQSDADAAQSDADAAQAAADAAQAAADAAQAAADAAQAAAAAALPRAGGTMTGAITLSGAPTTDLHAATKLYIDQRSVEGSGVGWMILKRPDGTRIQLCFGTAAPTNGSGQLVFNWPRAFSDVPRVTSSVTNAAFLATSLAGTHIIVNPSAAACAFQAWLIGPGVSQWVGASLNFLAIGTPS